MLWPGAGSGKAICVLPWDCRLRDDPWQGGTFLPLREKAPWVHPEGAKSRSLGERQAEHRMA